MKTQITEIGAFDIVSFALAGLLFEKYEITDHNDLAKYALLELQNAADIMLKAVLSDKDLPDSKFWQDASMKAFKHAVAVHTSQRNN